MKWNIEGFSQKRLIEMGLDVIDAVLIRFIADFYLSGKMQKVILDEREWFWLCYAHILAELPILGIEKRQLANRMDKLTGANVIQKKVLSSGNGSRAYIRFIEDTYCALVSDNEFVKKEKMPTPEGETMEKEERKLLRDAFVKYYELKAVEIRGERVSPSWGAKEAALLKGDSNQLGLTEILRCIKLFFADAVDEVKSFVRVKEKAGYGYAVFHGMIPKLSMSPATIADEPCESCGAWKHKPNCTVYLSRLKDKRIAQDVEDQENRDDLVQVDISALFNAAVGKKILAKEKP